MALLLQKQKQDSISAGDAGKNAGAPTITAVASCSSSSEGGSAGSPAHGASRCSSRATNGSGKPKSNPVAALLRSLSGKALKRSGSTRKRCGDSPNRQGIDAGNISDTTALDGTEMADAAAARAAVDDRMEAGALQMLQLDVQRADGHPEATKQPSATAAAGFHSPLPHAASTPGLSGRPATPLPPVAGLARGSGQPLGRPSAADVWREAGWDAAGGVPVGIITLEDVLEELMQVGVDCNQLECNVIIVCGTCTSTSTRRCGANAEFVSYRCRSGHGLQVWALDKPCCNCPQSYWWIYESELSAMTASAIPTDLLWMSKGGPGGPVLLDYCSCLMLCFASCPAH